jgi:hypothetical protein
MNESLATGSSARGVSLTIGVVMSASTAGDRPPAVWAWHDASGGWRRSALRGSASAVSKWWLITEAPSGLTSGPQGPGAR